MYREWAGRLKPTLRQVHIAGERLFVDFAGHTMEVIDEATGEIHRAEVFVGVLGASRCCCCSTQDGAPVQRCVPKAPVSR